MRCRVGFFIVIISLTACSGKHDNEGLAIFRYNESSGIATLDPAFAKDQSTIWATNQLFNSLVQLDKSLNIQPSIAKGWKISQNSSYSLATYMLALAVFK